MNWTVGSCRHQNHRYSYFIGSSCRILEPHLIVLNQFGIHSRGLDDTIFRSIHVLSRQVASFKAFLTPSDNTISRSRLIVTPLESMINLPDESILILLNSTSVDLSIETWNRIILHLKNMVLLPVTVAASEVSFESFQKFKKSTKGQFTGSLLCRPDWHT